MFKIRKMHKLDDVRVFKFLHKEVEEKNLMKNIKGHIRKGVCYKLQNEKDEIKGVFLALEMQEHISLSYCLVVEELRRKPISLKFFLKGISSLNLFKPIFLKKNKNFESYRNYCLPTEDEDIFLFLGLKVQRVERLLEKWAES